MDLLEIAALVYGADAAVSRGGATDRGMGRDWHRGFRVEMPVRDPEAWSDPPIKSALEETLMALSGDRFDFAFVEGRHEINETRWFDFKGDSAWMADRVLMFSGGLDSFAGALQEIVEHRNRVALVSHFSSTKIAKVQRDLCKAIAKAEGSDRSRHFPVHIQLAAGSNREGTHRTRSFLFAVLGLVTALAFGRDRVSFHENGVISLNLPPVGSVVGTRATRTTHPQVLDHFTRLFGRGFGQELRVDNPLFWHTKTEVLKVIERLGMGDQIRLTSSCADTHNRTRQHPHCGRCSQCIDRRFAVLAARLERRDPGEAYALDLMESRRTSVIDREMVLSYLRNALAFEVMTPADLQSRFPAIVGVLEHLGEHPDVALGRATDVVRRHGAAVAAAMRRTLETRQAEQFPDASLPRLFGDLQRAQALGLPELPSVSAPETATGKVTLLIDPDRRIASLDGVVHFRRNATADLLIAFSEVYLEGAGSGLDPLDYQTLSAAKLAKRFHLESDEHARKRVIRAKRNRKEMRVSESRSRRPRMPDREHPLAWIPARGRTGYRTSGEQGLRSLDQSVVVVGRTRSLAPEPSHEIHLPTGRDRAIGSKRRQHAVMAHVLAPGLVIFRRPAVLPGQFRECVANAVR